MKMRKIWSAILVAMLCLTPSGSVFAAYTPARLPASTLQDYAQNNILYYDPCGDEESEQTCIKPEGDQITWIGDSYSVGAQPIIEAKLPGITFGSSIDDANSYIQGCKFVNTDTSCNAKPTNPSGIEVLKRIIAAGELKPYLVFAVGTNGGWTETDVKAFQSAMEQAPDTTVLLVNSRTPTNDYATSNQLLEQLVNTNSNFYLVDWTKAYDPNFFVGDSEQIHPVSNGGYTKWVETILSVLPQHCIDATTKLPGTTLEEKVWNWMVDYFNGQNLSGYDIPAVVAEAMAKFYEQSGVSDGQTDAENELKLRMLTATRKWDDFVSAVKIAGSASYQPSSARSASANQYYSKYASATSVNPTISSSSSTTGDNQNYAGETVWDDHYMELIEKYQPVYESAAQQYGIPWQAIATMHRLETGMSLTNPSNGQGLYQLYSYTGGGSNSNSFPAGEVDMAEFQRQTNIAAEQMKSFIEAGGYDPTSDEGIKFLLFSYNGRASQYIQKALSMGFSQEEANVGEGSPYVMNRYDARRDPNSSSMDPNWPGRYVADGVYDGSSTMWDFGGFVQYQAIGGGNGSKGSGVCGTPVASGDIAELVVKYAWPEYHSPVFLEAMPDYKEAYNRRIREGKYVGSRATMADCGGFVTALLQDSGFDPDYGGGGNTYYQESYVINSPDWELVNPSYNAPISDESDLQPGDVAFTSCGATPLNCGHTYVYVGEISGFNSHIASASWDERTPMAGTEGIVGAGINWYHKVK